MTKTPSAEHPSHQAAAQRTAQSEPSPAIELNDAELDRVSGGDAAVGPVDVSSGLPTGKRMHKPY